jgi:hypothetical protein
LDFSKRTITVAGQAVEFNTKTWFPVSPDLSGDMGDVASAMAWWGSVWAAAAGEQIATDTFYRAWRARTSDALWADDPKLSLDKVKNKVEAHPDFSKLKAAMALAEENVTLAKCAFQALEKKGNMLQSLGANSRSELRATGMSTPIEPKPSLRIEPKSAKDRLFTEEDDEADDDVLKERAPDPAKAAAGLEAMKKKNKGKGGPARFKETV